MDSREPDVPTWDGSAKGWRRYCREVTWFVQATKVSQRRLIATKLIARLTGSARLLAMSWPQAEFDSDQGVVEYMQRLAKSLLVRRSLPNAAAIMTQYFGFKRGRDESTSNFLVREVLSYEEFQEALLRLKEERSGVDPSAQAFGVEEILRLGEEAEWWQSKRKDWKKGDDDDDRHSQAAAAVCAASASGSPSKSVAGSVELDGSPKMMGISRCPLSQSLMNPIPTLRWDRWQSQSLRRLQCSQPMAPSSWTCFEVGACWLLLR